MSGAMGGDGGKYDGLKTLGTIALIVVTIPIWVIPVTLYTLGEGVYKAVRGEK